MVMGTSRITRSYRVHEVRSQLVELLGDDDEARSLLAFMLDVAPIVVSLAADRELQASKVEEIMSAAQRRLSGEPLAYCTGRAPFRNLVLDVDSRVLIPRPETEILVDEVLSISERFPGGTAVDIGTGSGAIAIALAAEGWFERVIGTDVSSDALEVASSNLRHAGNGGAIVEFRHGSSLAPLEGVRARVIVSNPPYIAYEEAVELPRSVRDWEPPAALFAAGGGMAFYDLLFDQAVRYLEPDGWLVLEVDSRRAALTAERAKRTGHFTSVELVRDLTERQRVLVARASS